MVWRRSERGAKMTSKTVLDGLKTLIFLQVFVPKMCPKKVASMGLSLVPVAIRLCWYKPLLILKGLV